MNKLYELYKTPSKTIIKTESYTHPEAFPLSIEFWSNGDATYTQSASSTRLTIENVEEFRSNLLEKNWKKV